MVRKDLVTPEAKCKRDISPPNFSIKEEENRDEI